MGNCFENASYSRLSSASTQLIHDIAGHIKHHQSAARKAGEALKEIKNPTLENAQKLLELERLDSACTILLQAAKTLSEDPRDVTRERNEAASKIMYRIELLGARRYDVLDLLKKIGYKMNLEGCGYELVQLSQKVRPQEAMERL